MEIRSTSLAASSFFAPRPAVSRDPAIADTFEGLSASSPVLGPARPDTSPLQTILAAPTADEGPEDVARKRLQLSCLKGSDADIDAIYRHLQSHDSTEHRSWLQRTLHMARPYEKVVREVTGLSREASTVLGVLEGLERAALPGESARGALKRFQSLLETDADYGRFDVNVAAAQEAFRTSLQGLPWSSEGGNSRWERFLSLAREVRDMSTMASLWPAMAAATTEAEYQARRAAHPRIVEASHDSGDPAVAIAYKSLTEGLGPSDSVDAVLPDMLRLLEHQAPRGAAQTWCISGPERAAQTEILSRSRSSRDDEVLLEGLHESFASESFVARADALKQALEGGESPSGAVELLRAVAADLGDDVDTCLGSYMSLVSLLRARERNPLPMASTLLSYARDLRREGWRMAPGLEPTSLAEMLMGLTQTLLLGSDPERAKTLLRGVEEQRREAFAGQEKVGVDVQQGEIVVDGIRIPRRTS